MRRIALVLALLATPALARAEAQSATPSPADAAFAEMKAAFGSVPGFFRLLPVEAVSGAWEDFKGVVMNPKSAIPPKYKDLISLAVASQVPCVYCIYADTEFAKLDGATDREIKEAVMMAALTRKWSTVLNGSMQDEGAFRKEIDAAFAYVKKGGHPAQPIDVVDAASATKDIEGSLGLVPTFLKRYPPSGLAGAWNELKMVQFNPSTALPGKYKELIGIGVAAQIPCRYCLYAHTEAAKMNGATQAEIDEAIAVASSARHWSTLLNGLQVDPARFRKEVDALVRRFRAAAAAEAKKMSR